MFATRRVARHVAIAATVMQVLGGAALAEEATQPEQITSNAAAPVADVTTSIPTSAATAASSRVHVKYSGYFYGPSLGDMGSAEQPLGGGDLTLYNALPVSYDLTSQNSIAITPRFNYIPVKGHHLDLLDPRIAISRSKVANIGPVQWGLTRMGLEVPVIDASRAKDRLVTLMFLQSFSLSPSSSRWSIGADIDTRLRVHQGAAADSDIYAYLGVYPAYQISPSLAAVFNFEMDAQHLRGASITDFEAVSTYLRPSLSWNVSPDFNVSPYVAVPVFQSLDAADTQVGMELAGTFF